MSLLTSVEGVKVERSVNGGPGAAIREETPSRFRVLKSDVHEDIMNEMNSELLDKADPDSAHLAQKHHHQLAESREVMGGSGPRSAPSRTPPRWR